MLLAFLCACISFSDYRNLVSSFNHRIPTDFLNERNSVHIMITTSPSHVVMKQCMSLNPKQHQLNHCLILGSHLRAEGLAKFWKHYSKKKTKIWSFIWLFSFENSCASIAGCRKIKEQRQATYGLYFAQNKTIPGMVNGTSKKVGLRKLRQDLEVSFLHSLFLPFF